MNIALYKLKTGGAGSISIHNFPLPYTGTQSAVFSGITTFFIAIGIMIGFGFVSAFFAFFLVYERQQNIKHQQLISGVNINAFWLSTYLCDIIMFQIPMCECASVAALLLYSCI